MWHFLPDACKLIHILHVTEAEECNNYTENSRYRGIKFSYPGDQIAGICEPLLYSICKLLFRKIGSSHSYLQGSGSPMELMHS